MSLEKVKNIAVVDDHRLFRQQIAKLVKKTPNVAKVFEAGDGNELLKILEDHSLDLILLDLNMPHMDGFETLLKLNKRVSPPVIVVSMFDDEDRILQAYKLGIKGYLHKDAETEEFKLAVETVLNGELYFAKDLRDILFNDLIQRDNLKAARPKLTQKEIDVLRLICKQKTSKEISSDLCISLQTVNGYRISLLRKTGCQNMTGLAIYAFEHGLHRT